MQHREALVLKLAILGIGAAPVAGASLLLVTLLTNPFNAEYGWILYTIVGIMFISLVPFLLALKQAYQLLNLYAKQQAFTTHTVKLLHRIQQAAFTITVLYSISMPFFFALGDKDDAPGIVLVGLLLVSGAFIIAIFARILEKIFAEAVALKLENELTV